MPNYEITDDVEKWLKTDGEIYLKNIGIRRGYIVLDFGCGDGHYTIPAAKVVGKKGLVYAQDKDKGSLDKLAKKAGKLGLENIRAIRTKGEPKIDLKHESLDAVLLYDVLHFHTNKERKKIYQEAYKVLKKDALLSVFPRHHEEKMQLKLVEVKKEIEKVNFHLESKFFGTLLHDVSYVEDYVLNFRKK